MTLSQAATREAIFFRERRIASFVFLLMRGARKAGRFDDESR
jgi:hypothetical protein